MAGRPNTCTPEVQEIIIKALKEGLTRSCALRLAGIPDRTFRDWLTKAQNGDETYLDFAIDVECAEASAERDMTSVVVSQARDGNLNAATYWLDRRVKEYNPKSQVTQEVSVAASPELAAMAVRKVFGEHGAVKRDGGEGSDS